MNLTFEIRIAHKNSLALIGHHTAAYRPANLFNCFTSKVISAFLLANLTLILKVSQSFRRVLNS